MNKVSIFQKTLALPLLACVSCLLWGSAFPAVKLGYEYFNLDTSNTSGVILFAGLRFVLAGIFVAVFYSVKEKRVILPKKGNLVRVFALGIVATGVQYLFFYVGLANTTGSKASVIQSLSVFFCVIVACFIYKSERFTLKKMIGCILGFAGVIIVNLSDDFTFTFSFLAEGSIVLCALAYAFASSMAKKYSEYDSPVTLTAYQFIIGGAVMCAVGLAFGGRVPDWNFKSICVLTYLALLSAVAYTLWNLLLKYNSVSKVSVYGFLTPVFGVLLSVIILGESDSAFSIRGIISLILVCAGIFIINFSTSAKKGSYGEQGH